MAAMFLAALDQSIVGVALRRSPRSWAGAGNQAGAPGGSVNDVTAVPSLPEPLHTWVPTAFTQSMDDLFGVALPFLAVGPVIAALMREKPLGGREPAARPRSRRVRSSSAPTAEGRSTGLGAARRTTLRAVPRPGRHLSHGPRTSAQRSRLGLRFD